MARKERGRGERDGKREGEREGVERERRERGERESKGRRWGSCLCGSSMPKVFECSLPTSAHLRDGKVSALSGFLDSGRDIANPVRTGKH